MKSSIIIWFLIPVLAFSQVSQELDFIAPFSDGLAAVKSGDSWGFINESGTMVIPFRSDLVLTKSERQNYPVFKNNRCLISELRNGVRYFGYIDDSGKTVIKPQFLNASNFSNNKALALNILKEQVGNNDVLGKRVVDYRYFEVVINHSGDVECYLNPKGTHVVLDRNHLKKTPVITSRKISENLYAVRTAEEKWKLVSINDKTMF